MTAPDPIIADLIRRRMARGWTILDFSRHSGIPRVTLIQIEAGGGCQLATLRRIAAALGCELKLEEAVA